MRVLTLIIVLSALMVGGFIDMAHATAPTHACGHLQLQQDNHTDDEPCHSEQEQSHCDDCCCVHSHSMATPGIQTKSPPRVTKQSIIVSADNYYSTELSGLKRPPRF